MTKSHSRQTENWTEIIKPQTSLFDLRLKEIWRYRDLLTLLVRRDFVAIYKQTILGPLWFFIQPILTTIMFVIVFGRIAGIKTGTVPPPLFYLAGITLWNYFSECLNKTATVFKDNAAIFGKVYFPRLIMPLAVIVSNLMRLGIQLFVFFIFLAIYIFFKGEHLQINATVLLLPFLIIMLALQSLGFGLIISALTKKYRDLIFLMTFGVQLFMYATPVVYPLSQIHNPQLLFWIKLNPLTAIIETFRYGFLGEGDFDVRALMFVLLFSVFIFFTGVIIFNRSEKNFIDTY